MLNFSTIVVSLYSFIEYEKMSVFIKTDEEGDAIADREGNEKRIKKGKEAGG